MNLGGSSCLLRLYESAGDTLILMVELLKLVDDVDHIPVLFACICWDKSE